jgi:hypothetical protein
MDDIGFDQGVFVGYTAIVLSFLLVFFGIRSYRDNVAGGEISFGRGFTVGILITLISCVFYVLTWQVVYFKLKPGFSDQYMAHALDKARARGATAQQLEAQTRELRAFKEMYDRPLYNAAFTFVEPFPSDSSSR